jgi:hypothetical protein
MRGCRLLCVLPQRYAFRQTLHAINRRLELLCSLPPEKLAKLTLQSSARQLAQDEQPA